MFISSAVIARLPFNLATVAVAPGAMTVGPCLIVASPDRLAARRAPHSVSISSALSRAFDSAAESCRLNVGRIVPAG